jgi:hypothetical protein
VNTLSPKPSDEVVVPFSPSGLKVAKQLESTLSTLQKDAKQISKNKRAVSKGPRVSVEEAEEEEEEEEEEDGKKASRSVPPPISSPSILKFVFKFVHGFPLSSMESLVNVIVSEWNEKHPQVSGKSAKAKKKADGVSAASVKRTISYYCSKDGLVDKEKVWRVNDDAWEAAGVSEIPTLVSQQPGSSSKSESKKDKEKTEKISSASSMSLEKTFFGVGKTSSTPGEASSSSSSSSALSSSSPAAETVEITDDINMEASSGVTPSRRAESSSRLRASTPSSASRGPPQEPDPRAAAFVTSVKETVIQALVTYCGYSSSAQTSSTITTAAADSLTSSNLSLSLDRVLGTFATDPIIEKLVADFQIAAISASEASIENESSSVLTLTSFTDEQAHLLVKIVQGSSAPLSLLGGAVATLLSGRGLIVTEQAVIERIPRVLERHAHGIKPPKGVISSQDIDNLECVWRWEAVTVDHLNLPVEVKVKKSTASTSSAAMVMEADASDDIASGAEDSGVSSSSSSSSSGVKSTVASRRLATFTKREKENLRILGEKIRSSKRLVELLTPPPVVKGAAKKDKSVAWVPDETKVVEANERHLKALRAFDQLREKEAQRIEAEQRDAAVRAVKLEAKMKEKEEKAKELEQKATEKAKEKEAAKLLKEQAKEKERQEELAKMQKNSITRFFTTTKPVASTSSNSSATSLSAKIAMSSPLAAVAATASSSSTTASMDKVTSLATSASSPSSDVIFLSSTAPIVPDMQMEDVLHIDPISGQEELVQITAPTTSSHSSSSLSVQPKILQQRTVRSKHTIEQLAEFADRIDKALHLGHYASSSSSSSEMVVDDVQEEYSAPSFFGNWVAKRLAERRAAQIAAAERSKLRADAARHKIAIDKAQKSLSSAGTSSSNRPAANPYAAVFSSDFGGEENESDDAKIVRLGLAKGMSTFKVLLPDPNYERPAYFGTWSRERAVEVLRKTRNEHRERLLAASGSSGSSGQATVGSAEVAQGWDPKLEGSSSAMEDAEVNVPYIDLQAHSHKKLSRRSPFGIDNDAFDYLIDSEAEWEEETPVDDVEDLERASNDGDEDEEAALVELEGGNRAGLDNLDYEDGWLCPDDVVTFDKEAISKEKEKERVKKAELEEARALKRAKKLAAEAGEAAVAEAGGIELGANVLEGSMRRNNNTSADASGSDADIDVILPSNEDDEVEIVPGEDDACDSDLEFLAMNTTTDSTLDSAAISSSSSSLTVVKRAIGVSATSATPGAALHVLAKRELLDNDISGGGGGASKKRRIELTRGASISQVREFSFGVCFNLNAFLASNNQAINKHAVASAANDLLFGKVEAMGFALSAVSRTPSSGLSITIPTPEEDLAAVYDKLGLTASGEKKKATKKESKAAAAKSGTDAIGSTEGGEAQAVSEKDKAEAKIERAEKKAQKEKEKEERVTAKEAAVAEKVRLEAAKGVTLARLPILVKLLQGSPAPIGKVVDAFKSAIEASEGKDASALIANSKIASKIKEIATKGNWVLVQPSDKKKKKEVAVKSKKPTAKTPSSASKNASTSSSSIAIDEKEAKEKETADDDITPQGDNEEEDENIAMTESISLSSTGEIAVDITDSAAASSLSSSSASSSSSSSSSAIDFGAVGVIEKFISHDLESYILATMMALKSKDAITAEYTKSRWVVKNEALIAAGVAASSEMSEAAATIVAWINKKIEKANGDKSVLAKIAIPSLFNAKGGVSGSILNTSVISKPSNTENAPTSPVVGSSSSSSSYSSSGSKRKVTESTELTTSSSFSQPASAKKKRVEALPTPSPIVIDGDEEVMKEDKSIGKNKTEDEKMEDDSFVQQMGEIKHVELDEMKE